MNQASHINPVEFYSFKTKGANGYVFQVRQYRDNALKMNTVINIIWQYIKALHVQLTQIF